MGAIVDTSISDKCWNMYDSYGEICVHCGCCSKDPLVRAKSRLEVMKERLQHWESFDAWDKDKEIKKIQKHNVGKHKKYCRDKIKYYQKKVEGLEND